MAAVISVSEARQRLLEAFQPVGSEMILIEDALGRVISQDIVSGLDWPPFANSSMDGFAVRAKDVEYASAELPVILAVTVDIPAGTNSGWQITSGQAARIMTGAPLPEGADAVVPIENTNHMRARPGETIPARVSIFAPAKRGSFIRPRGQDIQRGQAVLRCGHRLRPQDIGILATLGITRISVYSCPSVAVLSTGDEVVAPDQPLQPGQIHDSNSFTLAALVKQSGGNPLVLGTTPDNPEQIRSKLDLAVQQKVDLIITSAGVSVGVYDYVRLVIEEDGRLDFWRVNMRPGKPIAFGQYKGTPIIGLPGNPASAFVGFMVFVRQAISRLSGFKEDDGAHIKVVLTEEIESDGRESYLRGIIDYRSEPPTARLTGHQGSGNLFSLVQANALLIIPSGVKSLPAGSEVEAWLLEV